MHQHFSPEVDQYINDAPEFAQPILEKLREVIHLYCPHIEESIKWKAPHFLLDDRLFCSFSYSKMQCNFSFTQYSSITSLYQDGQNWYLRLKNITDLSDLPNDLLWKELFHEAIEISNSTFN